MPSSTNRFSFFAASGWRAGLATLEIAVSRQIDVRPPAYTPAFVLVQAASAARDLIRRSRKFVSDFPRLRRLDGPRFTRRYYRRNLCEGNSATLRFNLVNLCGGVGFAASAGPTAARLRLILSVLDAVESIEEMDPSTIHLHALKSYLSVKEAAMRMKWRIGRGES